MYKLFIWFNFMVNNIKRAFLQLFLILKIVWLSEFFQKLEISIGVISLFFALNINSESYIITLPFKLLA